MKTKIRAAIESAMAEQDRRQKALQKEQQTFFKMASAESKLTNKEKENRFAKASNIDLSKYDLTAEKARHEAWIQKVEKEYVKSHRHKKPPLPMLTNYPFPQPMPDSDLPIQQDACFFPAMTCTGNGCDANQATLHPEMHSGYLGGDWGVMAYVESAPTVHTLSYGFTPPSGGSANVLAQVVLNGFIEVHSDLGNSILNKYYQHANADARLVLRLTAIQNNVILQTYEQTIISLHANPGNARKREFHNELALLSLNNVSVSAGAPVVIQFIVEAYAEGQSGFAHATINFAQAIGRGIQVPHMCYFFREVKYGGN